MPLIRRDPPCRQPQQPRPAGSPADLDAAEPERRLAAIRALSGTSEGAERLGQALGTETVLRLRDAILAGLVAHADAGAAAALAAHLRSDDAGLRNSCIEALQEIPAAALPILPDLLADADPDVRLLAAEVARTQPPEIASALLARLLGTELHPNVCAAAVEVLAESGTAEAVPSLRAARARFAADPFLPGAIDTVLASLVAGL